MDVRMDAPPRLDEGPEMGNKTELPLRLHKANLALQLRIATLVQEGGRQWLDFGRQLLGDGIAEGGAEARALRAAHDWQALATLPGEAFWRQLQQRLGEGQAAARVAISAQTAFADGLQAAVRAWQKDSAQALADALGTPVAPDAPAWGDPWKSWQPLLAGMAGIGDTTTSRPRAASNGGWK